MSQLTQKKMLDRNLPFEEKEAIELMLSGKREVEDLVAKAESLCFPDYPPFLDTALDDNDHVTFISRNDIKTITSKVYAEKDAQGIERVLEHEFFTCKRSENSERTNMKLVLRTSLMPETETVTETIKLPNEMQIQNDLLGADKLKIIIHNHIGNAVSEVSYDEYCDSNEHDDFLLDHDLFKELKIRNKSKWEGMIGTVEYGRLKSRFHQAISGLDLNLGKNDIEKAALRALSISAAYTIQYVTRKISDAVKAILGTKDTGEFILQFKKEKTHFIQCHLGLSSWTEEYYGIGMMIECDQS